MKKTCLIGILAILSFVPCIGQSIDYDKINSIIKAFSSESPSLIADYIEYPLQRRYPLPAIKNKQEFIDYFAEIFDLDLIQLVGNSNPINDWNNVGWRGVMFSNGDLWLSENYKIVCINYESILGKVKWQEIVNDQKKKLPLEYQNIDNPIYEWNSEKHHYRLDEIKDSYRLMIWDKEQIVLQNVYENGKLEPDGNIGYFHIDWTIKNDTIRLKNYNRNGEWKYKYSIYDYKELLVNEEAQEKYIDVEIK